MSSFDQIEEKVRFSFGKNWQSFLSKINEERIDEAEKSLKTTLKLPNLEGMSFLDVGSGSGLFSLAARRLGAKVYSFDYDPDSVRCTAYLRSKFFPDDPDWIVDKGSILDDNFLNSLGTFDIVYSWGVLHHTGNMYRAFNNIAPLVKEGGWLFIAIYNDQGYQSKLWGIIKKSYCSNWFLKLLICSVFIPLLFSITVVFCIFKRKNIFSEYKNKRGMSIIHDWFDWLGGYPFEVAKVEDIFVFFTSKKFTLKNIKTTNRIGNNQFVFWKEFG